MTKKVLIITPRFPLPDIGADEKDRFEGIKQLRRLGFDVRVIAKVFSFQDKEAINRFSVGSGIPVTLLEYENKFSIKKLLNPFYWDGAAYEYSRKSTKKTVEVILDEWHPDLLWVDYTYLWPLYGLARKRNIPIITRSINFEPSHFLQEDGRSVVNFVKFLPKLASELMAIKKSNFIFSITPNEERTYKRLGAKNVAVLPLRGLSVCLDKRSFVHERETLKVIFMGSTYNVRHNRAAIEAILKDIAPSVREKCPGQLKFYVSGSKIPEDFKRFFGEDVIYAGRKDQREFDDFLADMDIAVVPSLFGAGMQQKIFEPLCRGIPAVVSSRGLVGYPFRHREHALIANGLEEFPDLLLELRDRDLRRKLSENSVSLSKKLFSREKMDDAVLEAVNKISR